MINRNTLLTLAILLLGALVLGACGGARASENTEDTAAQSVQSEEEQAVDSASADEHAEESEGDVEGDDHAGEANAEESGAPGQHVEDDGHAEDQHDEGAEDEDHDPAASHGVPPEAAAVANPIGSSNDSIERGAAVYAQSCAVCHGESGKGDGPGAAALDPKPADFYADHVRSNTDGALFWIITKGREDTAMPPWDNIVSEEDRWHLVNFIRSLQDRQ